MKLFNFSNKRSKKTIDSLDEAFVYLDEKYKGTPRKIIFSLTNSFALMLRLQFIQYKNIKPSGNLYGLPLTQDQEMEFELYVIALANNRASSSSVNYLGLVELLFCPSKNNQVKLNTNYA